MESNLKRARPATAPSTSRSRPAVRSTRTRPTNAGTRNPPAQDSDGYALPLLFFVAQMNWIDQWFLIGGASINFQMVPCNSEKFDH